MTCAFRTCLALGTTLVLSIASSNADAMDRYYGENGQFIGSSTRVGKTTLYFDHQGRYSGSRVRSGIINDPARRK